MKNAFLTVSSVSTRRTFVLGKLGFVFILLLGALSAQAAPDPHTHTAEHSETHGDEHGDEHGEQRVLALSAAELQAAGIAFDTVRVSGSAPLTAYATVVAGTNAQRPLTVPLAAQLLQWLLPVGSAVQRGQPIAQLRSAEAAARVAAAETLALELSAAEQLAQQNSALFTAGIIARQEWQASELALAKLRAAQRAGRAELMALPAVDAQGRWQLVSPADGVLIEQRASAGAHLAAGEVLAQWLDPHARQLQLQLPITEAASVQPGLALVPKTGAWRAKVSAAVPLDGQLQVWAQVQAGELPPLGSAMAVEILAAGTDGRLSVPQTALQQLDGEAVVFVLQGDDVYAQPVLLGRALGERREIIRGLHAGQQVAADNAFLLKAELAKGEAEHEH